MLVQLSTSEIDKFLRTCSVTTRAFIGTFPSDQDVSIPSWFPFSLVFNTDPSGMPGSHWVAVYVENNSVVEYFDSVGEPPTGHIAKWLSHFPRISRITRAVQPTSSVLCGYYCLYFIYHRTICGSFSRVIRKFSYTDKYLNDRKVTVWYRRFTKS